MKKEILNAFGKVSLTVEYDAAQHLVYNNWQGYQTMESIMKGANSCLDLIEQHHCAYLLNDNSLVVGPWDHATDWIAQDWTPRAVALGLTHFAHVVSAESFAALSAESMFEKISGSFRMRIFGDLEDAKHWLGKARQPAN